MKHFFAFIALAAAFVAVSCQSTKEQADEFNGRPVIKARFESPITKVSYAETAEHKLTQTWEVDDVLVGKDDNNNDITMKVASVDGEGVATLEITEGALPASGSIHMMYLPAPAGYPSTWPSFMLDISSQTVASGTTVPAILTADAAVSGLSINLSFVNRTAILGIKGFHGLPAGATIDHFVVSGVSSMATVSVSGGTIEISPMSFGSAVVYLSKGTAWTANANGEVDDIFYVAALPNATAKAISIQAQLSDGSVYCNELGSKTVAAAKYYYMNDKALSQVVAYVAGAPYFTIEDAIDAVNDLGGDCSISLVADCAASQELYLTSAQGSVSFDLNGHTLDLNNYSLNVAASGLELDIADYAGGGSLVQTGGSSLLYVTDGIVSISNATFDCSGTGRILRMGGGTVNIHDGTVFICRQSGSNVMHVNNGTLNIDGGEFEHMSSTNAMLLYAPDGNATFNITGGVFRTSLTTTNYYPFYFGVNTPINIGGEAVFINTGSRHTFYFLSSANSNNAHITGGYHTSNKVVSSSRTGVATLSGGYFRSSSLSNISCSIKTSHSVRAITPAVTKEGYSFGYRMLHTNVQRWGFTIADGVTAFPAQRNAMYTPSSGTWAFQTSDENYTSGYNADQVNLFTWGLPSEYTNPSSASGLMGLVGDQSLGAANDWASFLPTDGMFTLTKAQWEYLLNTRSGPTVNGVANARYMKCTFQNSPGLLIFPDEFTWPANAGAETTATAINDPNADFSITYYRSPAGYLNAAGCIFLRADGYRDGESSFDCGIKGYYWSSTTAGGNEPWYLYFDDSSLSVKHSSNIDVTKGAAVRAFSH